MMIYVLQPSGNDAQWDAYYKRERTLPGYRTSFGGIIYVCSEAEREEIRALLRIWLDSDPRTAGMNITADDDEIITVQERS